MAKTYAEMDEENRIAAENALPLPHDISPPAVPLMEMPVDEFLGALPEITGGDQEKTNFLMREYNRINSLTGGMDSDVGEGRTGIAGNFLSKPEGSTGWDAVRGLRVEPRAGATGVAQGVESALTATGRAAQGTMPDDDMTLEAFGAAGLGAVPGLASAGRNIGRVDESMVSMFGTRGTSGRGVDPERVRTAVEMKRQGVDDGIIWEDTGLEWNPTLKDWEFEIDSSGLKLTDDALQNLGADRWASNEVGAFTRLYRSVDELIADDPGTKANPTKIDFGESLGQVFGFDELYAEYPFLADAKIVMRDGFGATYDAVDNVVEMGLETMRNKETMAIDPENFKSVLVHELQHGIQSVNSMAPGGSNNKWIIQNDPEIARMRRDALAYEAAGGNADDQFTAMAQLAYNKYRADLGEIQARAAEMRREMTEGERRETPPSQTYRMALQEQMDKYRTAPGKNMPTAKNLQHSPPDPIRQRDIDPTLPAPRVRRDRVTSRSAFAEGGLVSDVSNNAMSDYFKASAGLMTEEEFIGKHKVSTRDFENKFEETNNVDISGAESFTEITNTSKGDNMRKQMSFFNEGGMAAPRRDPVSGNEIPLGSSAENVRDDIDAKLSEGEYVVPADVVRFFGVNFFEQLRDKAKGGLQEMAADQRIGGQQTPPQQQQIDPEMVRAVTQMAEGGLVDSSNINQLIDKVVQSAKTNPELQSIFKNRGIMMSEGGLVTDEEASVTPSFNAAQWNTVGGSYGAPGNSAQSQGYGGFNYVPYTNANGNTMMILYINGSPAQTIPEGYTTGQAVEGIDPNAEAAEPVRQDRDRDDRRPTSNGPGGEMPEFSMGDPLSDVNFDDSASVIDWAKDRLSNSSSGGDWGAKAASVLGGVLGGPIGGSFAKFATSGYEKVRDVAVINAAALEAEDRGDTATAEALRAMTVGPIENFGLMGMIIKPEMYDGDQIHANYLERRGELGDTAVSGRSAATGTSAGRVAGDGGGSSYSGSTGSTSTSPYTPYQASTTSPRPSDREGRDSSGTSGSVAGESTSATRAAAMVAARDAGVSAGTSAGLSGSQMQAGSGIGTGDNGENEYGPMNRGGLVSRPPKKK